MKGGSPSDERGIYFMKKWKNSHLIISVMFIGIILSFSIFFGVTALFENRDADSTPYFDGKEHSEMISSDFCNAFYRNNSLQNIIREYEFKLFGLIGEGNIISGYNDFLFEKTDEVYDYDYLKDFCGRSPFSEAELEQMYQNLCLRQKKYDSDSVHYILAVIPNSQSVYSENMPIFVGIHDAENSRLSQFENYVASKDPSINFLNLTDSLIEAKEQSDYLLYNNTDNSLNALGEWYAFRAIYDKMSSLTSDNKSLTVNNPILDFSSLSFYSHTSEGRRLARISGLMDIIKNHTVSLSTDLTSKHFYVFREMNSSNEDTINYDRSRFKSSKPYVVLAFSNEWDKILIQPYMSNTFFQVGYTFDMNYSDKNHNIVIHIIHENELSSLLNSDIADTYR